MSQYQNMAFKKVEDVPWTEKYAPKVQVLLLKMNFFKI